MKALTATLICCCLAIGCAPPQSTTGGGAAGAPSEEGSGSVVAQKAVAGVGKQGQLVDKHSDVQKIVSGPAGALFKVKQKAVLEIQIPQALQLFKATNGEFPKNHQEFMTHIVEANRLQLPELPEGAVYHFNSEKGELWVYPEDEVPSE